MFVDKPQRNGGVVIEKKLEEIGCLLVPWNRKTPRRLKQDTGV
jgi:hypothetical protein